MAGYSRRTISFLIDFVSRKAALSAIIVGLLLIQNGFAFADDTLQFFQEEADVVTASRAPQPANQAPATVYVVTAEDIKDSGALSIPEALRSVPGVQVLRTSTGQSEVGIRGLDGPTNNRVLVLLDGRSVQSGHFNNVVWETIPVELDQIDRIEVVEGPASAIYGANAVSGVVNIISKTPEQLQGGKVSYTGGERSTELGSLTYGRKQDNVSYRFAGGWHSTNHFDDASSNAAKSGKFNGMVDYALSDHSALSLSGGLNRSETLVPFGLLVDDTNLTSFLRTDYHYRDTSFRFFWNRASDDAGTSSILSQEALITDTYDMSLEQAVTPFSGNHAVFGTSYTKNTSRSTSPVVEDFNQDLWALYFEDKWQLASKWLLMTSGRVDRHPLTPFRFSPRGSLLYTPVPDHVFRVSAGTAFRNPTSINNYLHAAEAFPNPGGPNLPPQAFFPTLEEGILGNKQLDPETIQEQEVAYDGRWDRVKATVTGFHYSYNHFIENVLYSGPQMPPAYNATAQFQNIDNSTLRAWGSELATEYYVTHWLSLIGNYTYEYLYETVSPQLLAQNTPRHEANVGFRTKNGGLTTQWMVNWVDSTYWPAASTFNSFAQVSGSQAAVNAYFLVNAHVGYAFSGNWSGLEVGVSAFNLLNHDHYEVSPVSDLGEIVKSSLTGTVSYKF